ncbi:MAG TPA: MaoC/PaaZ C-terminal domain-containing protein [Kofleriaceae bacterium]|nr:MaoC/PaaZ C-terminal domain-containing protein [Kofleriaceae bacterium]
MTLNHALVGAPLAPTRHAYAWRDAVIYALGVGARVDGELDYLDDGRGPRVLPTFAVVPSFGSLLDVCARLGANPLAILHGEQTVRLHRPIPASGTFETRAEVTGIYDKGKGALVVVVARTADERGEPLFENEFSLFVRGEGGFGGERGPEARAAEVPAGRAPDWSDTQATSPEQAALYRLSGDLNPLHIAPEAAAVARFERPILHGLCTYGFAGRAVLRHACGGDPARFASFAARFSGVVLPGDTLTTSGWRVDRDRWIIQVTKQDGAVVLSHSVAETRSEQS